MPALIKHHDRLVQSVTPPVQSVPPDPFLVRHVVLPRIRLVHGVCVICVAVPRAADAGSAAAGTAYMYSVRQSARLRSIYLSVASTTSSAPPCARYGNPVYDWTAIMQIDSGDENAQLVTA